MFTGLIETTGTVKALGRRGNYRLLTIKPGMDMENIELGESIAVDGCCLTVTAFDRGQFTVEASQETTRLTIIKAYDAGCKVNLERALLPTRRLGGHMVSGHIDGLGRIVQKKRVGESWELEVAFPREEAGYLVPKGSVAINGISLTVNTIEDDRFRVNIIPHTYEATTLASSAVGADVNLEYDIIGKYIVRLMQTQAAGKLTIDKLIEYGW